MNAPQEELLGEKSPQLKDLSIAKVLPSIIGTTIGFGCGPSVCKAIGEATGWGTYSIATNFVSAIILGVVGGFIGLVIYFFGKRS